MAQLLSNLPVGAKVKFGKYSVNGEAAQPIVWLVVAKNHSSTPAYPANSITLLTARSIDARCVDAKEPSNSSSDRVSYGNNRYSLSNIDQWLNKDSVGGAWYIAQHSADQAPNSASVVAGGTAYAARPGFLNAFTAGEKNAIQNTTIRVAKTSLDGGGYEDISRKVFLASATEVGISIEGGVVEGSMWSWFSNHSGVTQLTPQATTYSLSEVKSSESSGNWYWWLRTPRLNLANRTYAIKADGTAAYYNAYEGNYGIRPTINLLSTLSVSDTTDSDGCYITFPNSAPSSPTSIVVPSTIYGGKSNSISWGKATDPDGDTITYQLECSINGGAYAQIYSGASTTYAHLVPFGTTSVAYRVKATDTSSESSAYTTSATKTVVNNNAPVISGTNSNLGVKSSGFTGTYTITDANSDVVTVTEAIDGVQVRSLVATLGQAITYGVTENTWLALPNGSHTLTIQATDGLETTVRTLTFTKLVETLKIQNAIPWISSTMPTRIMLVITRNIPSEATFKVEVCNNGYDDSPTWEDCTNAVKSGLVHVFSNTTKTTLNWAVVVRVTVERNGATGACYVSAIGGNFE
jgi:hypothetical protein